MICKRISYPWLAISVVTLLGAVLRTLYLNQGLWYDEIVTLVKFVTLPFLEIVSSYPSENQHFLYSILSHIAISVFGVEAWVIRLPAVFFGFASIPIVYLLGRELTSCRESLLAAFLLTFSYHHIWFSQNARGYTGLLFWTLLSTYFFLKSIRESQPRYWSGYSVSAALGVYTHLTMGFVLISHAILYFCEVSYRKSKGHLHKSFLKTSLLWGFGLTAIFVLFLFLPVLSEMIQHFFSEKSQVSSQWTNPLWTIAEIIQGMKLGFGEMIVGVIASVIILGGGLYSYLRENPFALAIFLLPGVLGLIVMIALQHNIWPRFFFFCFGFLLLIIVRGATIFGNLTLRMLPKIVRNTINGTNLGTGICAVFILFSIISIPNIYKPKQDYMGALEYIEAHKHSNEFVVTVGLTKFPYLNYYKMPWEAVNSVEKLESILTEGKTTWLVYTFPIYMESRLPEVWKVIQTQFVTVKSFDGTVGDGDIFVCKSKATASN